MKPLRNSILFWLLFLCSGTVRGQESLVTEASNALDKALVYYSTLAEEGGYLESYTPELARELRARDGVISTIDARSSGTQEVGRAYLRAWKVTGDARYLEYAKLAGDALVCGQRTSGGWYVHIRLSGPQDDAYGKIWSPITTQPILTFLMALYEATSDMRYAPAINRGLQFLVDSQYECGGWPPYYPLRGGAWNCCSLNDGTFSACVDVMLEAWQRYGKPEYYNALQKAMYFLHAAQLPPPNAGWAQHYTPYLQPTWFRTYEPPSIGGRVTAQCIDTLMDLFLALGEGGSPQNGSDWYLEPIPDALRWLRESRLPNSRWARFYEITTNKPLYYDKGRKQVDTIEQLSLERQTGYGYNVDIDIDALTERYETIKRLGCTDFLKLERQPPSETEKHERLKALAEQVTRIIREQDASGSWITKERFRVGIESDKVWDGKYSEEVRISGREFLHNVQTLCEFIEISK